MGFLPKPGPFNPSAMSLTVPRVRWIKGLVSRTAIILARRIERNLPMIPKNLFRFCGQIELRQQ
jgi:hypothetical protein